MDSGEVPCGIKVVPFVGTWIEMLIQKAKSGPLPSYPSWVRGLKYFGMDERARMLRVVPFVGTWIEIPVAFHLL